MWELFTPDPTKVATGERYVCTVTDRGPIVTRMAGTKRFRLVSEDCMLGTRVIVEGDSKEETSELHRKELRKIMN